MGLLKHLLFWPVTGPEFLTKYSLQKVHDMVREELTDDQSVKEDLLALQMDLEMGEIDDAEFVRREAELMQRLRDVRHWREEFGMGTGGGPVRVAREPDADETLEPPAGAGGIASSEGANVELHLGWDDEGGC
jgi:hypothetical protein